MLRLTKISTMIWQASVLLKEIIMKHMLNLQRIKIIRYPLPKIEGTRKFTMRIELRPKMKQAKTKVTLLLSPSFMPVQENNFENGNTYRTMQYIFFQIVKIKDYECTWNADSY